MSIAAILERGTGRLTRQQIADAMLVEDQARRRASGVDRLAHEIELNRLAELLK